MNESMEIDNEDIQGTVRGFFNEILDCVEAESNWIGQLLFKLRRGLAHQVVDVLIREAFGAIDSLDSGAVDVDRLGARIHNRQVLQTEQRQIIEGQLIGEPDRSSILLSTCFNSKLAATKPSPSSRSLSARIITKEQNDSDRIPKNLACSQSEDSSSASNLTEDTREYPKYTKMKTVTTSSGEIRVPAYYFDDMEEIELDGHASKQILTTNTDANNESKKKSGFFSRMGKFFRRLCCFSVQVEE